MVELAGVSKRFGAFAAVRDVGLRVQPGEFLTLLGPSGCGKTTLLRLIAGFDLPDAGRILLAGEEVTAAPPYRRAVNLVFQSYALFPHLNVRDNIAFGLRMQRLPRAEIEARVEDAIQRVALGGLDARRPHQLSGGQKQRVALARALVCRPKVLLLDEPLAALDAQLRQAMQRELKELHRALGVTFIFVTHDQAEAMALSDRIAVMHEGRIAQLGPAAELYHRPANAFVAAFIGRANLFELASTQPGSSHRRVTLKGFPVELRVDSGADPGPASAAFVSVRPECVRVLRDAPPGENVFRCVVRDRIFEGAVDRLRLQLESGLEIQAELRGEDRAGFEAREGETVFCQLPPAALSLIAASGANHSAPPSHA
jgi:spermidine/putrescine transport system ATP-binding protein